MAANHNHHCKKATFLQDFIIFFGPGYCTAIKLPLRRTLVRAVILLSFYRRID